MTPELEILKELIAAGDAVVSSGVAGMTLQQVETPEGKAWAEAYDKAKAFIADK